MESSSSDQALVLIAFRQARRRAFNDRLAALDPIGEVMPWRCECGLVACGSALRMTEREYADVRAHPRRFVVLPAHIVGEAEYVADSRRGWTVVEKLPGPAAAFVTRTHVPATQITAP
ncbi:MAG TPA: hypothetical protein VNS09_16675 [Solirubrobacter sp.]|nr:hypothetical protein [Solirubrobacter sp.]